MCHVRDHVPAMELPPPPSPPPSAPPSSPPAEVDAVPLGHTPFSWRADASVAPPSERRPPVGRVDNVWGDRNLFCSCPPVASYE